MNRKALVYIKNIFAGELQEVAKGYTFQYADSYLKNEIAEAISSTIPLQNKLYESNVLFTFFDGMMPEGCLFEIAEKNWKLNNRDRMGLLLACCKNCIGAVSIKVEHEKV